MGDTIHPTTKGTSHSCSMQGSGPYFTDLTLTWGRGSVSVLTGREGDQTQNLSTEVGERRQRRDIRPTR